MGINTSKRAPFWRSRIFGALLAVTFGMVAGGGVGHAGTVTIKVGHLVAQDMAPLFVAKEAGCFQKYGLNVDTVFFANPGDENAALAGGSIDVSTIPFTLAYLAANNGVPIKVVASAGGWGIQEVVAQKSLGIKSLADLKAYIDSGKPPPTVAVLQGDTLEMIMRTALAKEDIPVDKVKFVYFNDLLAMVDAFRSGKVDILSHIKPYTTDMEVNQGATLVTTSAQTWSLYTPNTLVAVLNKTLVNRPNVVKGYLEGLVCGGNIMNTDPQKAVQLLSNGHYFRVSPAVLLQAIKTAPAPVSFIPDTASVQQVVNDMSKLGYIKAGTSSDQIFDLDMIKKIQASELQTK